MTNIPEGIQLTPFDPEFERDPYGVYARLRDAAPVHWDGMAYTASGYAEVAALLKDKRLTVDPRKLDIARDPRADNAVTNRVPDMMGLDGSEHTRLRTLVNRAFTPSSVNAFRPTIQAIAQNLVADLPQSFDAVERYAKPLPTIAIAEYIGIDATRHEEFKLWTDTLLMQGFPIPSPEQWDAIVAADAAMRECMRDVVEDRKMNPQDDFVTRLIASAASEAEVVEMCSLLVGAGNFTTTDLIGNALLQLTAADRNRLPEFVDDVLRLDPPSQSVRRWALEDIEIAGTTIKAGSAVLLFIGAANHDPQAGPHLSFGRGVHHCLGAALAKLEVEVALAAFPRFEVQSSKLRKSLLFRGYSKVMVEQI